MGRQALALFLFIVALLTKTVTATLPAALLVVFWWQRGKVRWREDVVPLLPFFAVALAAGLTTAWVERNFVGAQGFEFELSPLERVLIAGRAVWFYAGKLAWPSGLTFIYPRWEIDATALWQWAFPAAALVLLFVLWRLRHRSRAPLAAALLFGGTLFPALGFVDVFPFRYSFVADHFQYLASIAPIALFAAAVTAWASPQRHRGTEDSFQERVFSLKNDSLCLCASVVICSSLAFLTWRQSHQYVDAATLYTATLERNPGCWMCHNNLAKLRFESAADRERALAHIDESLRINPRSAEGHHNRGVLLRLAGRHAEALREQQEAVRLLPAYAEAHNELGLELQIAGRPGEALAEYERALQLKPRYAEALANAAEALGNLGRGEEALARVREALAIRPQYAPAHDVLGTLIARSGRIEEALEHFDAAVRLDPANAAAHNDRGTALAALGRNEEAAAEYAEAVRLHPNDAKFQDNLGYLLLQLNRGAEALPHFEAAVAADPGYAPARLNLANVLLAAGRPAEAIPHYERVLQQPGEVDAAQTHNNLGIAYATSGRRAEAIAQFEEALRLRPDFQQARENLLRARGK